MRFRELEKVAVGGPRGRLAPRGEVARGTVIGEKGMTRSQGCQHARQCFAGLVHRDPSSGSLDGNSHEAKLRNGRRQQYRGRLSFDRGNPGHGPLMLHMIGPTPGDENIDVQEIFHGKSERNSRTDSVVSGGWFSSAAKIIAPVCGQRTCRGFRGEAATLPARRRRYSETLTLSFLA